MNASQPTPPKNVAPTVAARFKSTLARLIGAETVDKSGQSEPTPTATSVETIWSKEWCAQKPELAAIAIETLQDRVGILEDYINTREWGEKPRKRPISLDPKGVYLSTLPPSTYFLLIRTGAKFRTSGRGWRIQYMLGNDTKAFNLHGASRVKVLHPDQI